MRKFNQTAVKYMTRNFRPDAGTTVFPGRSPVHLLVQVGSINTLDGRGKNRFFYNGKWNYEVYKRALRVYNSLAGEKRSWVVEYTPTQVLYQGHLQSGVFSPARCRLFYDPEAPSGLINYGRALMYEPKIMYPIRVGGRVLLSSVKPPENSRELGLLKMKCLNNFRSGLGGFHRDLIRPA